MKMMVVRVFVAAKSKQTDSVPEGQIAPGNGVRD